MKPASAALIALLGDTPNLNVAELITITLVDGTVLRYCTGQSNLTVGGNVYSSNGPYPLVGTIGWKIGVEVDTVKLELWALLTNLVESQIILAAIVQGLFDNALVLVQRMFMATPGDLSAGPVTLLQGNISDIPIADALHAEFDVKSRKELLNIPMPYMTYQSGCRWPLYGTGCGLNKATFAVTGALTAGSGQLLLNTNLTQVDQWFNQGYITFTSGANAGVTRAVRTYVNAGGQILLFIPTPNAVSPGDAFTAYPGCDKLQSTCSGKFGNLINFAGAPYIPPPENGL